MLKTKISTTVKLIDQTITIEGWVNSKRDHGKLTFIDVRDYEGYIIQCVGRDFPVLNTEDIVEVTGKVVKRPERLFNPKLFTGEIEIFAESIKILNKCKPLPFPIDGDGKEINEDLRLQYRYLDLRRERLHKNLKTRAKIVSAIRQSLETDGFTEIETPILTQSTKEGARDFLVPSRVHPGKFYALPQSPQQYKQLLMTAGFKYFQIAKCFRDETPRADRGFEFTQIDIEMPFADEYKIMQVAEHLVLSCLTKLGLWGSDEYVLKNVELFNKNLYFPLMTYEQAIKNYNTDKPDLRTPKETEEGKLLFCWIARFPMFKPSKEDVDKLDSKSKWTFMHNPFSSPITEHQNWLLKNENIDEIQAYQYDLVCNGMEIGSGSIRSHTRELLTSTYKVMGYSEEEINASIGHMLEAFDFGTPPHGGIALGIDRLVMLACKETSMREVIAFPINGTGRTSVMDAPSIIEPKIIKELGLKL